MPLEYYVNALQNYQEQMRSSDGSLYDALLYTYHNILLQAAKEYPEHFNTKEYNNAIIISESSINDRPMVIYLSGIAKLS